MKKKKCDMCDGKGGWWMAVAPITLPYLHTGQKWIECKRCKGKGDVE